MIDTLIAGVGLSGAWLVTYLVHSTVLILGVWLVSRWAAGRPRLVDGLWKVALVGGIVTATAQVGLDVRPAAGTVDLESELAMLATLDVGAPALPEPEQSEPALSPAQAQPPDERRSPGRLSAALDAEIAAAKPAETPPRSSDRQDFAVTVPASEPPVATGGVMVWVGAAIAIWLALASLFTLAIAVAWFRLSRRLGDREEIIDGSLPLALHRMMVKSSVPDRIRLTSSPRLDVPIAFGVRRREICMPARAISELSDDQLEAMLAHEFAHLLRRDPRWRLLTMTVKAVLFVQPLNRLVSRRMDESAEMLCDDWAAAQTKHPLALARCLTEVAGWVVHPVAGAPVVAMAGHRSGLGQRVRRLVDGSPRTDGTRLTRWFGAVAVGVLGLVVMVAPGASGTPAAVAASAPPPDLSVGSNPAVAAPVAPVAPLRELEAERLLGGLAAAGDGAVSAGRQTVTTTLPQLVQLLDLEGELGELDEDQLEELLDRVLEGILDADIDIDLDGLDVEIEIPDLFHLELDLDLDGDDADDQHHGHPGHPEVINPFDEADHQHPGHTDHPKVVDPFDGLELPEPFELPEFDVEIEWGGNTWKWDHRRARDLGDKVRRKLQQAQRKAQRAQRKAEQARRKAEELVDRWSHERVLELGDKVRRKADKALRRARKARQKAEQARRNAEALGREAYNQARKRWHSVDSPREMEELRREAQRNVREFDRHVRQRDANRSRLEEKLRAAKRRHQQEVEQLMERYGEQL